MNADRVKICSRRGTELFMIDISRGKASEFDEIIDFIDFVFSKSNCPHDFPSMYPNLYRRTDESMKNMINLREDGVIKASVLCYPRTLVIGGEKLNVYGIGSVATHPRERGRGFMSTLMNYTVEEMKKEGVHLSNLGGRRSRYNHFGYEITGNCYYAELSLDSLRTAKPEFSQDRYAFKALTYGDREIVEACKKIYDDKPVHYEYDYDDFYLRMYRKNGTTPYAVYDCENIIGFIAYLGKGKFPWHCRFHLRFYDLGNAVNREPHIVLAGIP
jgi:GNAT superfamily N-acetyltransferase